MECTGDSHIWSLVPWVPKQTTAPFLIIMWVCPCGAFKEVEHAFDVNELKHPDFRDRQMKQRAEQDGKIAALVEGE